MMMATSQLTDGFGFYPTFIPCKGVVCPCIKVKHAMVDVDCNKGIPNAILYGIVHS